MANLIFDEKTLLDNNLFKYEQRLKNSVNRYIENGAILVTYYQISENATTVDRGLQDIDKLFGNKSPLRFNKILNFPLYGFNQANPNNTDESQVEDVMLEGDAIMLPSTIVPNPSDFFILNHLKMRGIFQVIDVQYDSMKVEGFYKIRYRLQSTSEETIQNLEKQSIETFNTELNAIGTNINPIIREDNFIKRKKIEKMIYKMIEAYKALFYNEKHNCFLFFDQESRSSLFDMCGNEFIAKYSLMNSPNSSKVIILHDKLRDQKFQYYYNNSIYNWIELDSPSNLIQKFSYKLETIDSYPESSFYRWSDFDIMIIQPLATYEAGNNVKSFSYFDADQLKAFYDKKEPASVYERLIYKYIYNMNSIKLDDISLHTGDALLSSIKHRDIFFYTPIIIYIIRLILRLN